jgi:DNA-binding GntR family transcriptional regulator
MFGATGVSWNVVCDMPDFNSIGDTVRQRTARELRNRIITGELAPGSRLDLDRITDEFGISRTPVREALIELSHEGLVQVAPRSGITVLGITPADAVDNFALLATLSGRAAGWATERAADSELAELRRLASAIVGAPDVVDANWRFHRALNGAAGSPRLLTFIRQAVRAVPSNYFDLFPEQEHLAVSEHANLLDAMERRDAGAARFIAEDHVLRAGEALAGWLAARSA